MRQTDINKCKQVQTSLSRAGLKKVYIFTIIKLTLIGQSSSALHISAAAHCTEAGNQYAKDHPSNENPNRSHPDVSPCGPLAGALGIIRLIQLGQTGDACRRHY